MPYSASRIAIFTAVAWVIAISAANELHAQQVAPVTEWAVYGHDAAGTKYSPAAQITPANVKQLVPVWIYRTGDFALGDAMARDETTPLFVDGTLYLSTPFGGVRALDPETGAELWSFDSGLDLSGSYGDFTNRGVSTWLDPGLPASAACHRRIYVAPVDARLIALDARTGEPCADFGVHGVVRLDEVANPAVFKGEYEITSPPAVVNGLLIVGSTVADGVRAEAPSGVVRAFDARTGALRWSWDPVPRSPAQVGYDTWRGPIAHQTGAANAWSVISADSARDLVFVPTGSASPDFFGGERLGQNLYANSVVALRASTGAVVWHFQVVHHDLWDYDVPAEPVLFTWHHNGKSIPALAQTTKMGHLFILDRETGKPLFPVKERPVPKSDVPGEQASPTQPFPTLPLPLVPDRVAPSEIFGVSDSGRAWCHSKLDGLRAEGMFTPPSVGGTVIYPGNIGGSNWGGIAFDPVRHLAIVPSNRMITFMNLIPRAEAQQRMASGTRLDDFAPQRGTPYAMHRRQLIAPDGAPCGPPPWGTLTAIDLESGAKVWERPFGRVAQLASIPGSAKWGSPSLGGAMTTGGGVIFAGGALDQSLHAYDVETGKELWSARLPAGVHASPMTYVASNGTQYVVVAAGGHKDLHAIVGDYDRAGDYIVAFALPAARPMRPRSTGAIATGHYEGHMVLDKSRYRTQWDLMRGASGDSLSFRLLEIGVEGGGAARIAGDSLFVDAKWTFAAQHCSGTMKLRGEIANMNRALVGELEYVDGCNGGATKAGTFAVWSGDHHESRVAP